MNFISVLIIAVGLGMDAFSVAIGIGAARGKPSFGPVLRLAFSFGLFQLLMPLTGWLAGMTVAGLIARYDHWIAFFLLLYVGGRMIMESFSKEEKVTDKDPTKGMSLIMLSVATSIDALAVGLSFAFLKIPILFPSAVIGVVTFLMTAAGMFFGKFLGSLFGKKVEILGGLILIGIGINILIGHMR